MILTDLRHKIKGWAKLLDRRDAYTALIIVIVAISSYMLGMLSAIDGSVPPVTIESAGAAVIASREPAPVPSLATKAPAIQASSPSATYPGMYVGSRSGDKYHLPWCSGAQRIAEANKVWFASKAEAESAGYTPAANCKGI
ncbi:MAG: hypothetical protein WC767_00210 [Candidatus Paceibacterota bacterium]|jgi:hypothetical protein